MSLIGSKNNALSTIRIKNIIKETDMHKDTLGVYVNGNTIVEIRNDGTKIRYVPDDVPAQPVYPESIDMKISQSQHRSSSHYSMPNDSQILR